MKRALFAVAMAVPIAHLAWANEPTEPTEPTEAAETEEVAEPEAQTMAYTLDASASQLYVIIYNDEDRWTPVTGHNHAISPSSFDGTVTWNPDDPSVCKVDIRFAVSSLQVDPGNLRAAAGLKAEGAISDGQKRTVVKNMTRGGGQLDITRFGTISYESTRCEGAGSAVQVTGNLSIHGVSKSVTLPMQVTADASGFKGSGRLEMTHTMFGMKPFTYGPGTPKNLDRITLVVNVKGQPAAP